MAGGDIVDLEWVKEYPEEAVELIEWLTAWCEKLFPAIEMAGAALEALMAEKAVANSGQ